MSINEMDIEKIVRLVTDRLSAMRDQPAAQIAIPSTSSHSEPITGVLDLSCEKVISQELIEKKSQRRSIQSILTNQQALITPAAKDYIRDKNLKMARVDGARNHSKNSNRKIVLLNEKTSDHSGQTRTGLVSQAQRICRQGKAVVIVANHSSMLACLINRDPESFAVAIERGQDDMDLSDPFNCFVSDCEKIAQNLVQRLKSGS